MFDERSVECSGDDSVDAAPRSPEVAALIAAVDGLLAAGVTADPAELRLLHHQVDRLRAVITEAEARFDAAEAWRDRGAASMRGWLMADCDLPKREATRLSRRVERLQSWPTVADAWRTGTLSEAQVDCMVAAVPPRLVPTFAEAAPEVIDVVAPLTADTTERAIRQWVRAAESNDELDEPPAPSSGMHVATLIDGSFVFNGELHGADAAVVDAALRVFEVPDAVDEHGEVIGEPRSFARRTSDALVAMARAAMDHREGTSEIARFAPHVSLVLDITELRASALRGAGITSVSDLERRSESRGWSAVERAWFTDALRHHGEGCTSDGLALDAAAIGALTCESVVQRVITAGSKVLEMGREVRTATTAQRRAVIARDRHCRAPGCRTAARYCEVHHVDHWALGGRTDVDRMVLLCGAHHREFHRPGYTMELASDARFTVTSSHGWSRSTMPERLEELHFPRKVAA